MSPRNLKTQHWTARIALRYSLLQIPAIVVLILAMLFAKRWVNIPPWVFWGSLALWAAKDIILFPFVWRAYDWERSRKERAMIGARGTTQESLAPSGYILVRGEFWRAEVIENDPPVDKGEKVQVIGTRGLTLIVQPYDKEGEVKNG